jgi:Spy/CpxP family protein refolding chaperone
MIRALLTVAVAAMSVSAVIVATAAKPQHPDPAPHAQTMPEFDGWSVPREPFDETPITPVESAGAPMFP